MAELNIKDIQDEIGASTSAPKVKKENPVQSKKRKADPEPKDEPQRRSRRLRSTVRAPPANETRAERKKREVSGYCLVRSQLLTAWWQEEQAKLQKEADEEAARLEQAQRLARMPRHQDLEFEVLAEDFDEEEMTSWKSLKETLIAKEYQRPVGSWEPESLDEKKLEHAKDDLVSELKKLTIVSRAKVCKVSSIQQYTYEKLTTPSKPGTYLFDGVPSYHCK